MTRAEVRKQFALSSAKKDGKYVTRDGRRVIRWRLIHDPEYSLWPVEVTVEVPHSRGRVKYVVNQNGRRYANVRSVDDIYEASRERDSSHGHTTACLILLRRLAMSAQSSMA